MAHTMEKNRKSSSQPFFLQQYFNVKMVENASGCEETAMARIINALILELNKKDAKLPWYLIVVMDKDILLEVGKNQSFSEAQIITAEIVQWMVRQITSIIRRKRMDLLEKHPGAVCETKIIFTRMLKRIGTFHEQSPINNLVQLRAKMNDALNNIVAKMEHYILTINGCTSYEHFDKQGKLSVKWKTTFWHEMDDLMRRFDANHLKLLLNLKNPPWQFGRAQHRSDHHTN